MGRGHLGDTAAPDHNGLDDVASELHAHLSMVVFAMSRDSYPGSPETRHLPALRGKSLRSAFAGFTPPQEPRVEVVMAGHRLLTSSRRRRRRPARPAARPPLS